ncbi:MAG: OadG family transporter subunit [Oscillospiraceae bacterium]|nr:OadG family transporter subunit [Oscillospiraceae bacterium]
MSAENLSLSLNVIMSGLLVTFTALVALVLVITIFGKIMSAVTGRGKKSGGQGNPASQKKEEKPAAAAIQKASVKSEGIPGDVIAVISAAVAAMMGGTGKGFAIKSIKKAAHPKTKEVRSAWSMAGIQQNTASF